MKFPLIKVLDEEVMIVSANHHWADCSLCPFADMNKARCGEANAERVCGIDYYVSPDLLAIARLKGEV